MATATEGDLEITIELSAWSCVSITLMAFPAKTIRTTRTLIKSNHNTNSFFSGLYPSIAQIPGALGL